MQRSPTAVRPRARGTTRRNRPEIRGSPWPCTWPYQFLTAAGVETVVFDELLANARNADLDAAAAVVATMPTLPAYPDVADGLHQLRDTPLTAVAQTTSPTSVSDAQLTNTRASATCSTT
jgi:hypothetical protein